MLPFVEVSHLPSSSSFYSAITQPLGLRFISAGDPSATGLLGPPTITYGIAATPAIPIFELRQVTGRPVKLSHIIFSAASLGAVAQFQAFVQKLKQSDGRSAVAQTLLPIGSQSGADIEGKITETDPDGNIMEVVYIPPPDYPHRYSGSTVRKTQSTESEVSRILSWNYDVAASDMALLAASSYRRPAPVPEDDLAYPVVRRSVTTTTTTTTVEPLESLLATPKETSSPLLSTGAMVGTLLGVAAAGAAIGAGVAYGAIKNDRIRSEFEKPAPQRSSTCPEFYPDSRSRYSEYPPPAARPPPTLLDNDARSRYSAPRSRVSGSGTRLTDSPRTPLMLTEAEHRSSYAGSAAASTPRRIEDARSYVSGSRHTSSPTTHVSSVRSKHTAAAASVAPSLRRSQTYDDGASYVSSRSNRTVRAAGGPPPPTAQTVLTASRADSYVSRPRSYATAPRSSPSVATTARRVPLPASGVGSSRAGWEEDDVADSIAPSDSISCVGSRHSARIYQ